MTAQDSDEVFELNDLPMAEDRDAAWRILAARGGSMTTPNDIALLSQENVETVLRDPVLYSSQRGFDVLGSPIPMVPISVDPPEHTRFRRILTPFFSPRVIRPLEEQLRADIRAQIEPIAARGSCNFVAEVADTFPIQTFLAFFGLPAEDLPKFVEWKDAILDATDATGAPTGKGDPMRAMELIGYLGELVLARRGVPGDDVFSQLMCLPEDEGLDDLEATGLGFLFVLAGLDTVTGSLGFGMERLARNPERRQEIVDDPSIIPAAIEELVRLDPPAPFVPRMTSAPTELAGRSLPEDARVTTHLAVANRDEAGRPHPFDIDFHRGDNPHASFGLGAHRCLGSHLARLEMKIVYEEWHKQIPVYELTPGTTPRTKWPRGTLGLESLELTFGGTS